MNNSVLNIKILDYTGNQSLTSFALSICPFTFISNTYLNIKNILWDFGDGTTSTNLTAIHYYQRSGNYNINLNIVDTNGNEYVNSFIPVLSVYDYIDNNLQIASISTPVYDVGAGDIRDAITIIRSNSWQSYNTLSATGYTIYPYASGALGNYLNTSEYYSNQWAQFVPYNKFLTQQIQNHITQYIPVSTYTTIDTLLYAYVNNNNITPCNSSTPGSIFVGTSGYVNTYFSSDIPKNYSSLDQPIILFYSTDNNFFSDPFTISTSYNNTKPAILPSVKIRNNTAASLSFSTNGIDTEGPSILSSFNIPIISWQNSQIPFVVKLKDINGFSTKFYPLLSSNNVNQTCNSQTYCLNVNLFDNTNTLIPGVSFYTNYINDVDYTKGGYFKGYFISPVTALNCYLSGYVDIQNKESYNIDTIGNFIYDPNTTSIYGDIYTTKYNFNNGLSSILYDRQINIQTPSISCIPSIYCSPISPLSQKQFGIWIIDDSNNMIYCTDIVGNISKTYYLSALNYADNIIDFTANTLITGVSTKYAASIDSNNNIWITLFGSGYTIRINTTTDIVDYILTPTMGGYPLSAIAGYSSQQTCTAPTTAYPYYNFTKSHSPYVPLAVNTDSQNNIWASYIFPISSISSSYYNGLVVKYNSTGSITNQILLPSFSVPRHLIVDKNDNAYIAVDSYDVNSKNFNTYIYCISSNGIILNTIKTKNGFYDSYVIPFNIPPNVGNNGYISDNILIPGIAYSLTLPYVPIFFQFVNEYYEVLPVYIYSLSAYIPNSSACPNYMTANVPFIFRIDPAAVVSPYYSFWLSINASVQSMSTTLVPVGYTSAYNLPALTSENMCIGIDESLWYQDYNNKVNKNFAPNTATPLISSYIIGTSAYNCFAGFATDTYDNINIINTVDNCIYKLNSINPTISSSFSLNNNPISIQGARGDWTGFQMIEKYAHIPNSTNRIKGVSNNFNIYPNTGYNYIAKINENIDMQQFYNSLRLQESLLDKDVFFNDFLGTIVGNISSNYSSIGKNIYEKITNYVDNNSNVNTANINALISLCQQYAVTYEPLNYSFPPNFRKVVDLLSISFNKLFGTQNSYTNNFNKQGSQYSLIYGTNLGTKICLSSDTFSLSEKVVAYEKYSKNYKLIQTAKLSGYNISSTLPFSAFQQIWGWNLVLPQGLSGVDIGYYYDFYRFIDIPDNTIYDSVINWNDIMTTVNYISTNYLEWINDNGIIDSIINYNLSTGLNLLSA
jgi:hypothetical protein